MCASPGFLYFAAMSLFLALVGTATAQHQQSTSVREIVVAGARTVTPEMIHQWMETKPGGNFVSTDPARIDSGFAAAGFPFGRIDSVVFVPTQDGRSIDVVLHVREGKRALLAEPQIKGTKAVALSTLLSGSGLQKGSVFSPQLLERCIASFLRTYESSGYPFAAVQISDLQFRENPEELEAHVELLIDEGTLARIEKLRVEGNSTTRSDVIARAAGFSVGDLYTGDLPARMQERLRRLQLFSNVSLPELFVDADRTVGLHLNVVEGSSNRFDGIVGYVPQGGSGGTGYVTGFVNLQFRNIFGTARRLSVRWNRETQTSQEIALRYREPWLFSLPVGLEGGYMQRKQDSTYVRESTDLLFETSLVGDLSVGLALAGNRVTPSEGFGQTVVGQSSAFSVGLSVSYDSRDDRLIPTSGFRYLTEYHTGRKEIKASVRGSGNEENSTQKITLDVEYYSSMFKNQVLAVVVSARDFRSGTVDQGDLYRLGGATTLRGYREGQFQGSRIAWSNLEYRLLAGQRSFVFAFVDVGYASVPRREESGLAGDEFRRLGYGAGAHIDTPLGVIGLSLAFGQGDTFNTAKLHLRIVNEF